MGPPARLVLDGELTIRTISGIHSQFTNFLTRGAELELDVAAATKIDISFVQLVVAARRSAEAAGIHLRLATPAAGVLRDVLMRGGFLSPVPGHASTAEAWWTLSAKPT